MQSLRKTRFAVVSTTVGAWLYLCYRFWRYLVTSAADSPVIYTRGPGFQLLNFALQYLWIFLIVLGVALIAEWALFRFLEHIIWGRSRRAV